MQIQRDVFANSGTSLSAIEKPLMLDLFCGGGGAGHGYFLAGFDIVGVDIAPQPRNPHAFYQADALIVLDQLLSCDTWRGYHLHDFAAIHASPPCQRYSATAQMRGTSLNHPDLIDPVRELLKATGLPYIIENVQRAPLAGHLLLCGTMFNLRTRRHRLFEFSDDLLIFSPHHSDICRKRKIKIAHVAKIPVGEEYWSLAGKFGQVDRAQKEALGIDWMKTPHEIAQAIPPAYTRYIGEQLLAYITASRMEASA